MTRYNPQNWYWRVGGDDSRAWSSAAAGFVPVSDVTFRAWVEAGGVPTNIPDMEELRIVLADAYPGGSLETYAAARRFAIETGGLTVGGSRIATDRQSQSMLVGAFNLMQVNPSATIKYKTDSGVFLAADAALVQALAVAVGNHVQACFAKEADVAAAITAGTIVTRAAIDAAFSAIG